MGVVCRGKPLWFAWPPLGWALHAHLHARLDDITDLQIVEIIDRQTALKAGIDLAHIVFAAFERAEDAGKDRLAAAKDLDHRVARQLAIGDATAADDGLARLENLHHLGMAFD